MIHTDWFLKQGSTHMICQDYVFAGDTYTVLADGCSGSKFTDFGSRILCMTAANHIERLRGYIPDYNTFGSQIISAACINASSMSLPSRALDATLMISFIQNGKVIVYCYGDGYVIVERVHGYENSIYSFSYEDNAPLYLSYRIDPLRLKSYYKEFSGKLSVNELMGNRELIIAMSSDMCRLEFDIDLISSITLFSDGVSSFQTKENGRYKDIPCEEIINTFIELPPGKGEFTKRRTNVAYRQFDKLGMTHYDDVSLAGLYIEE